MIFDEQEPKDIPSKVRTQASIAISAPVLSPAGKI